MSDLPDAADQPRPESSSLAPDRGRGRGRVRYGQPLPAVAYSNVFEVQRGPEELVLTMGYGKPSRVQSGGDESSAGSELVIEPSCRVALTPQTAGRLATALAQSLRLMQPRPNDGPSGAGTPEVAEPTAAASTDA